VTTHRTPVATGAVHIGSGWYIRRSLDGSVTITSETHQEEITLSRKGWIRAVASVSAGGLSDASLTAAEALHQGG